MIQLQILSMQHCGTLNQRPAFALFTKGKFATSSRLPTLSPSACDRLQYCFGRMNRCPQLRDCRGNERTGLPHKFGRLPLRKLSCHNRQQTLDNFKAAGQLRYPSAMHLSLPPATLGGVHAVHASFRFIIYSVLPDARHAIECTARADAPSWGHACARGGLIARLRNGVAVGL